ncbi:MAG: multidrug efflux SMR transporter [Hyphomicrobium sp.]
MGWIYLIFAGVTECIFTTSIRYSAGFTKPLPIVVTLGMAAVSFYLVARATETIPLGTVYAAWGALGVAGTAIIGIVWFNEPMTLWRVFFLSTLLASTIGLKLVSE